MKTYLVENNFPILMAVRIGDILTLSQTLFSMSVSKSRYHLWLAALAFFPPVFGNPMSQQPTVVVRETLMPEIYVRPHMFGTSLLRNLSTTVFLLPHGSDLTNRLKLYGQLWLVSILIHPQTVHLSNQFY